MLVDEYISPLLHLPNIKKIILPNSHSTLCHLSHILQYYPIDNYQFDSIFAIGGGSIMDIAKAYSYCSTYQLCDINASTFANIELLNPPDSVKPSLVVIPTTAGSGSEVTPFATIWDTQNNKKLSLGCDQLFPNIAFIDPDLHETISYHQTISSALDSINQGIESLASIQYSELFSFYALNAVSLAFKY